jgi:hypothetical protein
LQIDHFCRYFYRLYLFCIHDYCAFFHIMLKSVKVYIV